MSNVKDFLYEEQFTTATEALEFLNKSISTSVDYDAFGDKKVFTAVVLSKPISLANADTTSKASPGIYSGGGTISRFAFKARIVDDPSPHWFLPDPCKLSLAKHPKKQLNRIFLHTTFISRSDYDLSDNDMPRVGDKVFVRLEKNVFSYKLDFGEFVEIDATANIDVASAGGGVASLEACSSIESYFGGASPTTVAKSYSKTPTITIKKTPTAKAVVSSPSKAPIGESKRALTIPKDWSALKISTLRVSFGDSQIQGKFGVQLDAHMTGIPSGGRYGVHSTQPQAWLRCIGTGKCTDSKADVTKVQNMWAALEKKPGLIIISLGGNGVGGIDTLISELKTTFTRLSYEPYVIWQGPPPPIHKDSDQKPTKYYGDITKYNSGYTARNARGQTVKKAVEAAGWDFVDPYLYLKLEQDFPNLSGYGCKGCDGVHLTSYAARLLLHTAYRFRLVNWIQPAALEADTQTKMAATTHYDEVLATLALSTDAKSGSAGKIPKGMK